MSDEKWSQEQYLAYYRSKMTECSICHQQVEAKDVVILVGRLFEMLPSDWWNTQKQVILHFCPTCYNEKFLPEMNGNMVVLNSLAF